MNKKIKIIIYILSTLGLFLLFTGIIILNNEKIYYINVKKEFQEIERKNITKEKDITTLTYKAELANDIYKNELIKNIDEYKLYVKTLSLIDKKISNNILNSSTTKQDIEEINAYYNEINKKYQKKIKNQVKEINQQYNNIENIETKIDCLFEDPNKTKLKENIDNKTIEEYKIELQELPQKDIIAKNQIYLNIAKKIITQREQQKIEAAWIKLNVPYISQNKNNILNGCEAAAMLMGLQYKGYLTNMSLTDFVTHMPLSKNNDPYEGFTHDIYGLQPLTIPHWIAPPPLTKFGKEISGNQNIIDATGYSIDDLDKELDNNNPVIIYLIAKFNEPKEIVEGAPKNLHVMLLTGYNTITGEHYVVDPWTHDDGRTSWTVSKDLIENRYNFVGKKAVVIK